MPQEVCEEHGQTGAVPIAAVEHHRLIRVLEVQVQLLPEPLHLFRRCEPTIGLYVVTVHPACRLVPPHRTRQTPGQQQIIIAGRCNEVLELRADVHQRPLAIIMPPFLLRHGTKPASDTWPLKARVEAQAMGTPTFRPDSHTSIQHTHIQHADVAQDPPQPRREQGREPAHRHQGVCVHTEAQGHQTQLKGRQQVEPKKQVGGPLTQPPVQQQMKAAGRREVGG